MSQTPNLPQELSTTQVLTRIALRLVTLGTFAAFGSQGFARTFATLLMLGAIYCALFAAVRREPVAWHILTHWDEAAVYATAAYFISTLA